MIDSDPPHEGVTVQIGGQEFVVPPLTLGQLKRLRPKLDALANAEASQPLDRVDDLLVIVHVALSRNYPSLTIDDLADLIEVQQLDAVITAVMDASGLERQAGNGVAGTA